VNCCGGKIQHLSCHICDERHFSQQQQHVAAAAACLGAEAMGDKLSAAEGDTEVMQR
jgi:hypothetical protein